MRRVACLGEIRFHRRRYAGEPVETRFEQFVDARVEGDRGIDDDELVHALREVRRDIDGDISAERMADENHSIETQGVEQREDVAGVVGHRVAGRRLVRSPATTQVRRDDAERRTEAGRDQPGETMGIRRQAVQHDDGRRSAGRIQVVDVDAMYREKPVRKLSGRFAHMSAHISPDLIAALT